MSEWIKCSERMPPVGENFLLFCEMTDGVKVIKVGRLSEMKRIYWFGNDEWLQKKRITHWMPLPEPPKD